MNPNHRLDRVEHALQPQKSLDVFHHCTEHDDLSWEEHFELHRQHGEYLFTLDLGAANVREEVA
jgi:hypothetical protein